MIYQYEDHIDKQMTDRRWVLEVLQYGYAEDGLPSIKHVGYMKKRFKTRKAAVSYYDRHNPHMRSLNAHNSYRSDWDPRTHLLYVVRKDHLVDATVDGFPNFQS